jgi:hypothetical protein
VHFIQGVVLEKVRRDSTVHAATWAPRTLRVRQETQGAEIDGCRVMKIKDMQKKQYRLEVGSPGRGMQHTVQTHAVSSVRVLHFSVSMPLLDVALPGGLVVG